VVGAVLEERPFGPGGWPIPFVLGSAGSTQPRRSSRADFLPVQGWDSQQVSTTARVIVVDEPVRR